MGVYKGFGTSETIKRGFLGIRNPYRWSY